MHENKMDASLQSSRVNVKTENRNSERKAFAYVYHLMEPVSRNVTLKTVSLL